MAKNKGMTGIAHENFEGLRLSPDLYQDELVNARSRARTSEKYLHLAYHRLTQKNEKKAYKTSLNGITSSYYSFCLHIWAMPRHNKRRKTMHKRSK